MSNRPDNSWTPNGDFVFRKVADEAVLIPIRGGMAELGSIFTFNEVGAAIWRAIDPSRTAEDIAHLLADEFEVSHEKATDDVLTFLTALEERGLVLRTGSGEANAGTQNT